jgi:hypothetical protein
VYLRITGDRFHTKFVGVMIGEWSSLAPYQIPYGFTEKKIFLDDEKLVRQCCSIKASTNTPFREIGVIYTRFIS